jgi:hypothetical protein
MEDGLVGALGMSVITTAGYMLRRSRKDLKNALTKIK